MAKKIAEQLIDTLVESGVERIYAVTGDSLNEVNEAVRKNNKIQWIHVRHEETGAYAAAAEAQLTGRIGCCAGSSGPGHVHLINGLYDAQRSGAPVIAIASTIPSGEFGTEYFQETNTIKLFNDCSYYNEVATTPGQFPRMLQSAIQTAITRKGVAVVGLPGDLAKASSVSVDSSVKNYPAPPEVCPAEEDLIQLAELLNNHKRITLFCGIGCRGAHEEVIALSEKLNAPVVYTFKGKMEVQYENPYEVGMTGLLGMPSGYYSMHEAEVLLMLGTDFPYSAFLPDDIKIAQIDIKPERLGRRAKVDIGLCGDVRMTIQALLRMLDPKTDDTFLLKQALERRQTERLSSNFSYRMMERVHQEAEKQTKRKTRIGWAALLISALALVGLGVYVLTFYLEFNFADVMPQMNVRQDSSLFAFYVYIALLALVLLGLDYWLRKKYIWK